MFNVQDAATELKWAVEWQQTPRPIQDAEYNYMIGRAIRDQYVMTGRGEIFTDTWYIYDEQGKLVSFAEDLIATEEEYVLVTAQIFFFQRVQQNVNVIVGYTTDGLSITNADKPYANLQTTITGLESRRHTLLFKLRDLMML